jgi:hypothetical protein
MKLRHVVILSLLAASPLFAQQPQQSGQQPQLNSGGDIRVTTTMHPDGTRTDMQTDFGNNTAEAKTYDSGNKLLQRVVYQLDEQRQPTSGTTYNAKGVITMTATYVRDSQGHVTQEEDFSPDGKLFRKITYRYDTAGNLAGADAVDANGNPIRDKGASSSSRKSSSGRRSR